MTAPPATTPAAPGGPNRPGSRLRGVAGRLVLDVAPLQRPDYRRLWWGQVVSFVGTQVTAVAVPLQVYALTRSSLLVGLVSLAALGPLIVFGLLGGAIADAVDRRRLVLVTSVGLMASSAALTVQAALHWRSVWLLFVTVAVQSGFMAVDAPARRAFTPRLLPPALIPAATGLDQVLMNLGTIGGPLLAGGLVGAFGFGWAYGLDTVSFLAALYSVARLPSMAPEGGGRRAGVASVVDGLRFLRRSRAVLMTFVVDINAMVFGMPRALFPALAVSQFHGGARTAGLLYAAPAFGGLLGAAFGGWFGRVRRQGRAVLVSVAAWGLAITGFGLTTWLWLAVVFLAVAGGSDMVSAVFRNAILQVETPDAFRGRLNGVFIIVVSGGPRVGDVEAGAVAALVSPVFAVVSGGLACVAGVALLGWLVPSFRRYLAPRGESAEPAPA